MLFNSPIFIFAFLPIVVIVFFLAGKFGNHRLAIVWLTLASLFFYGWWNPLYVALLLASISCNYAFGLWIAKAGAEQDTIRQRRLLIVAIAANLLLLGYYKYANFFLGSVNSLTDSHLPLDQIILPLGISFFTFTQIAFLVDTYQGKVKEHNFIHYTLFVTYFPHLIAGPVLHHKEMMPQFGNKQIFNFRLQLFVVGLSIFFMGLFKKVMIADTIAAYSTPVFNAANAESVAITFFAAWGGALAYAFQLYYDFSGYSDMAIGISLLFGIRLPLNFYSPYKATNIIDFWRRWHMTLSRFLRDYLYIPLGGNQKGKVRRHINLLITMLLGGLWHGAGWTFVIWGGLHGCYLVINHAWRALHGTTRVTPAYRSGLGRWIARILTLVSVTVAWVFFRAENLDAALQILRGMTGVNGFILPSPLLPLLNHMGFLGSYLEDQGLKFTMDPVFDQWGYPLLLVLLAFTWFAPNTQQFMARYKPALSAFEGDSLRSPWLQWRLTRYSAAFCALLTFLAVLGLNQVSEFLYFQF